MADSIFQYAIFQDFILPFFLAFTLVFAVLERSKILGEDSKRLNAIIALVVGLVFVTAAFPQAVISNIILFLTVSLIVVFVVLLLWGFVFGETGKAFVPEKWMKRILVALVGAGLVLVLVWTAGANTGFLDWLISREWTGTFWTNFLFIVVVAVALALAVTSQKKS